MQSGNYTLNHGLAENLDDKCNEILESCDSENKFEDEEFDISAAENADGEVGRLKEDAHFINDGLDATDVAQGGLGDCWFLSALSSLAQELPEDSPLRVKEIAVQRVIQKEFNSSEEARQAGLYRFKFFKMGEWVDIVIDENLPLRRRAAPSETDEWWVPLTEKAYAKFCGSYDRIVGGNTCWAMTDLTGGITVEMKNLNADNADMIKEQTQTLGVDLFNIFRKIQNRAVVCTSNLGDGGNETIIKGLVCGHAYSLLQIDEVELEDGSHQRLVKIRNPWAQTEWEGPWGDGTEEWEMVPEYEKERIKYENKDDGGFWMSFQDWVDEFEMFTICMLPRLDPDDEDAGSMAEEEALNRDHRVIGTFIPGTNSPLDITQMQAEFMNPDFHAQIYLSVPPLFASSDKPRNVWLQYLMDVPLKVQRYLMFNVYMLDEECDEPEEKLTKRQLRNAEKIDPSLPGQKGYVIDYYRHNGYLFRLNTNRKYIIVATSASPEESTDECKFMVRTIGPRLQMKHLE